MPPTSVHAHPKHLFTLTLISSHSSKYLYTTWTSVHTHPEIHIHSPGHLPLTPGDPDAHPYAYMCHHVCMSASHTHIHTPALLHTPHTHTGLHLPYTQASHPDACPMLCPEHHSKWPGDGCAHPPAQVAAKPHLTARCPVTACPTLAQTPSPAWPFSLLRGLCCQVSISRGHGSSWQQPWARPEGRTPRGYELLAGAQSRAPQSSLLALRHLLPQV